MSLTTEPTSRIYLACGFRETRRFRKYEQFQWRVIEYEKELTLSLNSYRDEAGEFTAAIGAGEEQMSKILGWLDEELAELKDATDKSDLPKLRHQVYDMLFLLFELAARFDLDLDAEWAAGWERKREKYLMKKKTE